MNTGTNQKEQAESLRYRDTIFAAIFAVFVLILAWHGGMFEHIGQPIAVFILVIAVHWHAYEKGRKNYAVEVGEKNRTGNLTRPNLIKSSNKITADEIAESLTRFFDAGYSSLTAGFKDTLENEQVLITTNNEQNKELMIVSMFAIIKVIMVAFGDASTAETLIGKFQHDVFNKYFKDVEEKNRFNELFWKRYNEYLQILDSKNKD